MDAKEIRRNRKSSMALINEANSTSPKTVDFLNSVKNAIENGSIKDGSKVTIDVEMFVLDDSNRDFSESSVEFQAFRSSIDREGLINPLVFGFNAESLELYLVAGHRRLAAIKQLGWKTVPATYISDDQDVDAVRFAENAFRENLEPIELCKQVLKVKSIWKPRSDVEFAKMLGFGRTKTIGCLKIAAWRPEDQEFAARNNLKLTPLIQIATKAGVDVRAELRKLASKSRTPSGAKSPRIRQEDSAFYKSSIDLLSGFAQTHSLSPRLTNRAKSIVKKLDGIPESDLKTLKEFISSLKTVP